MRQILFTIIFTLFSIFTLQAATADDAARAYQQKDYIKAATLYAELIRSEKSHTADPSTLANYYYNWGNSLFRTKDYARAVEAYQCALRINPSDKDAQHNLQLTQSKLPNQFDQRPQSFLTLGFRSLVTSVSANAWGVWGILLLLLTGLCAIGFKLGQTIIMRKICFFASCTLLACTLLSFLFAYSERHLIYAEQQAVIMQPQQTYADPSTSSKPAVLLQEGVLVDILQKQSDGWTEIMLPDGTICWTKAALSLIN